MYRDCFTLELGSALGFARDLGRLFQKASQTDFSEIAFSWDHFFEAIRRPRFGNISRPVLEAQLSVSWHLWQRGDVRLPPHCGTLGGREKMESLTPDSDWHHVPDMQLLLPLLDGQHASAFFILRPNAFGGLSCPTCLSLAQLQVSRARYNPIVRRLADETLRSSSDERDRLAARLLLQHFEPDAFLPTIFC